MNYELEHIAGVLKGARERKGLSQRALSRSSGVPQGQISKIENGVVDLRVSSLIALARALDLEPSLVPRKSLSAVNAIIRSTVKERVERDHSREWLNLLNLVNSRIAEEPERKDYAQLLRYLRDLEHFSPTVEKNFKTRLNLKSFREFSNALEDKERTKRYVLELRDWRNRLAHQLDEERDAEEVKPAYSLDEDDDA